MEHYLVIFCCLQLMHLLVHNFFVYPWFVHVWLFVSLNCISTYMPLMLNKTTVRTKVTCHNLSIFFKICLIKNVDTIHPGPFYFASHPWSTKSWYVEFWAIATNTSRYKQLGSLGQFSEYFYLWKFLFLEQNDRVHILLLKTVEPVVWLLFEYVWDRYFC